MGCDVRLRLEGGVKEEEEELEVLLKECVGDEEEVMVD